MKTVLALELIGDNYIQHLKMIESGKTQAPRQIKEYISLLRYGQQNFIPWVARLSMSDGQIEREFLSSVRDYSDANSTGSRGIFEYYALGFGVYEINECTRLGKSERYFVLVGRDGINRIDIDNVTKRLGPKDPQSQKWD